MHWGPRPQERMLGSLRPQEADAEGAPSSGAGLGSLVLRSRQADLQTHVPQGTTTYRLALPAPTGSTLASSVTPARCSGPATCLFCHGVRVQPFHFHGEYPEREYTQHLQATAGSLPGESNVQKSLAGYCPRGREEADPTHVTQARTPPATGFLSRVRSKRQRTLKGRTRVCATVCGSGAQGRGGSGLHVAAGPRCHQGWPSQQGWTAETPNRMPRSSTPPAAAPSGSSF